jgi:enamine deaminase RidA (YjgF/YER057c/UK114 family)
MLLKWGHGLSVRVSEMKYRRWKIIYLTVLPDRLIKNDSTVSFLFSELYGFLKDARVKILLEKIYGLSSMREDTAAIRNRCINMMRENTKIPFTYIGSVPCIGGKIAGVQIIGVIQDDKKTKVDTIFFNEEPVGRVFETDDFKGIYLSGISGLQKDGNVGKQSPVQQAEYIVKLCQDVFSKQGMTARNIIRTWIYFPRILSWYKRFIKTRARFFKEFGLISGNKTYLPASTGIQGRGRPKEEIFLDLIAFVPKKKHVGSASIMRSKRQNEARKYGATFSRGVEVKTDNSSLLHISGTASINQKGKTIYLHDEQGQITETLINIGALLETKKAYLKDIVLTAAYCKNRRTYTTFKDVTKYLGLDEIPFVPVYADVCRDDLLFEIDAIAVKQHG